MLPGKKEAHHCARRTGAGRIGTQARYPWAQLWDWRDCERVLIVMPTPRNFYVLPKRNVDPAVLERLRGHLARARKRA